MMQRIGDYLERAFAPGPALVDPGLATFGVSAETYQSQAYANYPATSNAVYACIRVRATAASSLPIKLYSIDARGKRTEVEQAPALALLQKVNPHWTFKRLVAMTFQSMDIWGECFWAIERTGRGVPAELWWMRADRVTVHPDPEGYVRGFTYEVGGRRIFWPREDVVWFRTENIADEFRGLSPLAAARLSADTASAAMRSNYGIFSNGMQVAGVISPAQSDSARILTDEQIKTLQSAFDRNFKGTNNAHKVAILKFGVDFKQLTLTPQDAEFLGMMDWSLREVARAFRVPVDKIGGKSTFENLEHSERQFWSDGIMPDLTMIADEITEQLLPQFPGTLVAAFDDSDVDVLHESETAKWEREAGQLDRYAITINEWREEQGKEPVPWGDVAWMQSTLMPIKDDEKPTAPIPPALAANAGQEPDDATEPPIEDDADAERGHAAGTARTIAYDSDEHRRRWARQLDRAEPWERLIADTTTRLMLDQQQSVLARLRQRGARAEDAVALEPFDRARWIKTFRTEIRPALFEIATQAAALELDELGVLTLFDVQDPNVIRAMERQAQRFAEEVNQTTWNSLRAGIAEGIAEGEDIDTIADRVLAVMQDRIRSSKETIARTEVTTASTTGTLASWDQSGVVVGKQWLAALDDRTRKTHVEAHGQIVGLDDDFHVGGAAGPGPGNMGSARENINCRCSLVPVIDTEVPTVKLED